MLTTAATYAAFCRNYGDHCTLRAGSRSWNEEAIEGMTGDVNPLWQDLCSTLEETNESTLRLIEVVMDGAAQYLGESWESKHWKHCESDGRGWEEMGTST